MALARIALWLARAVNTDISSYRRAWDESRRRHRRRSRALVVAILPARNEESSLPAALESLHGQTRRPDRIIVCADGCTDNTALVARSHGAEVIETVDNRHKKAGAINFALSAVLPTLASRDFVLIMDADSVLCDTWVADAVGVNRPEVGVVSASFHGMQRRGLIYLLQRNEYARFARPVARKKARPQVLSGVASLFRVAVLRHIGAARTAGALPGSAGVYDTTAATEDIEMTFAVLQSGYRPLSPQRCIAYTDTMDTWRKLAQQRIRWQRGMLDSLALYGWNRRTAPYALRTTLIYAASLSLPLYLVALAVTSALVGPVDLVTPWLCVLLVFLAERVVSVRRQGWKAVGVASLLVVENAYEIFRSAAYWVSLARFLRRTERVWTPT